MRLPPSGSKSQAYLALVGCVALAHLAVLVLCRHPAVPSNAVQLLAALLPVLLCFRCAWRAKDPSYRSAWKQLGTAFSIWFLAQGYYFTALAWSHTIPVFPSPADFLWLLFAFPVLLVTITRPRPGARREWINRLDALQSCTFFCVLYALVFETGGSLTVSSAYEVQCTALVLACILRYTSTAPGPERLFFRNLGVYLVVYGLASSAGNRLVHAGSSPAPWVDLGWSLPPLFFCVLVLCTRVPAAVAVRPGREPRTWLPNRLHGLSALCLSILSIASATALHASSPRLGLIALVISLSIFAARTIVRESQLHLAHDTLAYSICHDALTGLANRVFLQQELTRCLDEQAEAPFSVAVLIINLDRFKTINDGLGHAFGDRLLIKVASLLSALVPNQDLVVKLGADEFAIMMEADEIGAQQLANAIVELLRLPLHLEDRVLYITASVGVVLGRTGMQPDNLLRDAECAMYAAKAGGKNQARIFELYMAEETRDELRLESDLREAIDSDGLTVHYQPIYSLAGQCFVGFEALARWQHASRGSVAPAGFIPLAEETGLILGLGRRVLHEACLQVKHWNDVHASSFTVSVNVSAKQFADPGLLQNIEDVLFETGFPPTLLHLEITESVLLSGIQSVESVLNAARELGIEISLDDFGTGYSSLSYLLRFPFDIVKIDRSFVEALHQDPKRAHLVRTIVQLAGSLGKKVIAEGVETEEEREGLEDLGCDLLQGFLYSRPLSAHLLGRLLRAQKAPPGRTLSGGRIPVPEPDRQAPQGTLAGPGRRRLLAWTMDRPTSASSTSDQL